VVRSILACGGRVGRADNRVAEVLNRIYDFLVDERIALRHIQGYYDYEIRLLKRINRTMASFFLDTPKPHPFSYLHVCRQMRQEIVPILRKRVKIQVSHYDTVKSIETFAQSPGTVAAGALDTIVLKVPPESECEALKTRANDWKVPIVDIHPLVRLAKMNQSSKIEYALDGIDDGSEMR